MAIPEPELELLREVLSEDPGNEAFLQVASELVTRMAYVEALAVIDRAQGVCAELPQAAWGLLAEAAFRIGRTGRAVAALERVPSDPRSHEHEARLRVLVLEQAAQLDAALVVAEAFLEVHPEDVVVRAVVERLTAAPSGRSLRLPDSRVNREQAEVYAQLDRPDRAIRTLRRLHYHFPDELALAVRIAELRGKSWSGADDLSEEIDEIEVLPPGQPPGLTMPVPGIAPDTIPSFSDAPTGGDDDPDDELTDPAIGFDLDDIRRQLDARQRDATPAPSAQRPVAEGDDAFIYGAPFDDLDDPADTAPTTQPLASTQELAAQATERVGDGAKTPAGARKPHSPTGR